METLISEREFEAVGMCAPKPMVNCLKEQKKKSESGWEILVFHVCS